MLLGPFGSGASRNHALVRRRFTIVVPVAVDHVDVAVGRASTTVVPTIAIAAGVRRGICFPGCLLGVDESLGGFMSGLHGCRVPDVFRGDEGIWISIDVHFWFWRDICDKRPFDHVIRKDSKFILQELLFRAFAQVLDGAVKFAMSISI